MQRPSPNRIPSKPTPPSSHHLTNGLSVSSFRIFLTGGGGSSPNASVEALEGAAGTANGSGSEIGRRFLLAAIVRRGAGVDAVAEGAGRTSTVTGAGAFRATTECCTGVVIAGAGAAGEVSGRGWSLPRRPSEKAAKSPAAATIAVRTARQGPRFRRAGWVVSIEMGVKLGKDVRPSSTCGGAALAPRRRMRSIETCVAAERTSG
jgi:hypothetical protein